MARSAVTIPAHLEVISPDGEIRFFPLEAERLIRLGRHPENDLVLDRPGLAPFHLLLEFRRTAYHLILTGQGAPVRVNGQALRPHTPLELHHLDVIEVGGYLLVLLLPAGVDYFPSAPPPGPSALPPACLPDPAPPISAQLSSSYWIVDVGQSVACQLSLINNSAANFTAVVEVRGVDESWVTITPPQATLKPGEPARVTLSFNPPWLPGSSAGLYPVAVMVTSPDYPGWYKRQDALLTIAPYSDFSLAARSPTRQSLSWGQQTGQMVINLTNKSNYPALFRLTATDEARLCRFEFQLPTETAALAGTAELRLAAGQSVTIPLRITPPLRPFIKPGRQVYPYTCTAALVGGRQISRSITGQIGQSPWIGPWPLALLALCLIAGITFALQTVLAQTWLRPVKISLVTPMPTPSPRPRPARATATPLPPPTATPILTYNQIFQQIAPQYGLDWQLLAGLAYRESRLNHLAVGRDNDMGLMQILPDTWNEWAPKVGVSDPFDPYSNVLVAAAYLAYLRDYCQARGYDEAHWMLIGYNWGPRNLNRFIESGGGWNEVPAEQRYYAQAVLQSTLAGPFYPQIMAQK